MEKLLSKLEAGTLRALRREVAKGNFDVQVKGEVCALHFGEGVVLSLPASHIKINELDKFLKVKV